VPSFNVRWGDSEALEPNGWYFAPRAYLSFCSMKQLGVFPLLHDRMLVHCRSLPCSLLGFPNNSLVPIYTLGWREALWELSVLPMKTTQCPQPGLEPGLLASGKSALTMRPLLIIDWCSLQWASPNGRWPLFMSPSLIMGNFVTTNLTEGTDSMFTRKQRVAETSATPSLVTFAQERISGELTQTLFS